VKRAKRPYEGMEAYESGRKDAIRDLYDELVRVDECLIINKDDIMKYLRKKIWLNNAKGE
jgi:hypothetical protein